MRVPGIIQKKRDGGSLTAAEIQQMVAGLADGSIPEYQWAALAMAIFFRGMTPEETLWLTRAMRDSGARLQHPSGHPPVVDKHSTGGIGDKVSLVLAPLAACCGVWVPMVSGRGLGITGGTLDKLESIPGFRVGLSLEEMQAQLASIGVFMAGQTAEFCPADRKLYALRDVTATVPSIPLITASILSKKLAENLDALSLDVKFGRGAFMQTEAEALALARSMEAVGRLEGARITTRLSPMDEPLGRAAGNALEVAEALECLQGRGPADLEEITLDLTEPLVDCGREELRGLLRDGSAWAKFRQMTAAQGGDLDAFARRPPAPFQADFFAPRSGVVTRCDALGIGELIVALGGGRSQAADAVDHAVGVSHLAKCGEPVLAGASLARIHARTPQDLAAALEQAALAFEIG